MSEKTNDNMLYYSKFQNTPREALKPIAAGRLKGMTNINPMYRIKVLTEAFGPCGIGWYTEIVERWMEKADELGSVACFVRINLYVKINGEWSVGIPGIGGSMFVAPERKGLYMDDECMKKAYTDAISVACKALGIGADIYYSEDRTKYDAYEPAAAQQQAPPMQQVQATPPQQKKLTPNGSMFMTRCYNLGLEPQGILRQAGWQDGQGVTPEMYDRCWVILDEIEFSRMGA